MVWLACFCFGTGAAAANLWINEILFNPPGSDTGREYIELRGQPNQLLAAGTYLLVIDGDAEDDPGRVEEVFDLSGRRIGGNGFLVLLQKESPYTAVVDDGATVLINTGSGEGWGDGSSSTIGHNGRSGRTDLINPSVTFLLVQSPLPPSPGDDIDADNNGLPDGTAYATWTVLDGVGVLDRDGAGDAAYAPIAFRRNATASSLGQAVTTPFIADYVARRGNTTGNDPSDWVAGDNLLGTEPNFTLGLPTDTFPVEFALRPLDHLGRPNFGAPALPGVIVHEPEGQTTVAEGGNLASYHIRLNTSPGATVIIQLQADAQLEISTDGGASFGHTRTLALNDTSPRTVHVRAVDDDLVEATPHFGSVNHFVIQGAAGYPPTTLIRPIEACIADNERLVLSELKVNPPGTNDGPFEYIELRGTPGAELREMFLLVLDGEAKGDPGRTLLVVELDGARLGANGLLLIAAPQAPYAVPAVTGRLNLTAFAQPEGALPNDAVSFLLVSSRTRIFEDEDLDRGDNGTLEELPDGTVILDAVAWSGGDTNAVLYGGVVLEQPSGTPDAAMRFLNDDTPLSAAAWFNGNLLGEDGAGLEFDPSEVSANFPAGTRLTPGQLNNALPQVVSLSAICGTIGDPTNPKVSLSVQDLETPPASLQVRVQSSNPAVVPDDHLYLSALGPGQFELDIEPVGVGYADIEVLVADDLGTNRHVIKYAASAMGRPGGRFLIGASDSSTAIPIDADWMFVGDDETQAIRIYNRHRSGLPIWLHDFSTNLALTDFEGERPREVDIEASTRVGDRIFWLGSHSHANIGEIRTNRARLFATDVHGAGAASTLTYVGHYEHLKLDLIAWDHSNGHGLGADYLGLQASAADGVQPKMPDGSGFNIEGLCMAPGSSNVAYVGFRAPIVPASNRVYALIVPLLNLPTVATSTAPPGLARFGQPIELDLNGRGIRSIEGFGTNYLIIAGPPGETNQSIPNDFKLYTWTGRRDDMPQLRAADLSGLNPEAIVELPPLPWTADSMVQIISDCGRTDWYGDGTQAKFLPEVNHRKSRMDWVRLGEVVKPQPYIRSIRRTDSTVVIEWRARRGERYRLQHRARLDGAAWVDLPGEVLATGPIVSRSLPAPADTQHFYRVVLIE